MEPIRRGIEHFLRGRYGYEEGYRAFRVLATPVLIGAIVVVGWFLVGPLLTIPRFTTEGPVVRNGVAVIVACAKKSGFERMGAAMRSTPPSLGRAREGTSEGATAPCGITTPRMPPSARRATGGPISDKR